VVAATNGQVAARVTPRLVDLVAALATRAVGSVALARPDVSDTLPGVAIAIALVPPLAVAGLTLRSGLPGQCLGALLLFAANVAAILASGIVVMALYRVGRVPGQATGSAFRRPVAVVIIVLLLGAPDQPASTETMWWARRRCTHHIPTRVGGFRLGSRSCLLRQACKPPDAVRQRLRDDPAIELRHCPIPYTRLNRPSGNCSTLCSSIPCRADDENNALPSPTISG
jgi:hypothetical protein